jgi:hypothetical protein
MGAAGENLVLLILMRGVNGLVINAAKGGEARQCGWDIGDKSGLS